MQGLGHWVRAKLDSSRLCHRTEVAKSKTSFPGLSLWEVKRRDPGNEVGRSTSISWSIYYSLITPSIFLVSLTVHWYPLYGGEIVVTIIFIHQGWRERQ